MYDPEKNPRAFRWTSLSREFSRAGYEVHVVANTKTSVPGVKVYGRHIRKSVEVDKATKESVKVKKSFLRSIIRSALKAVAWPDLTVRWVPWATLTTFKLMKVNDYSLVITSSHPMTSHLPVLILSKLKMVKVKSWISDFGDPFGLVNNHELNNQLLYGKLNFLYEKSVCRNSNFVSVTTVETKELYEKGYELKGKVGVIAPVLSMEKNSTSESNPFSAKVNYVFAGTLYKEIRNPKVVLEFAEYLSKHDPDAVVHFFGSLGDCDDIFENVSSNVVVHGLIDRARLNDYFVYSDGIINIGNNTMYQLPSKIIEAIAYEKFILNFVQESYDTSIKYLSKHPAHSNIKSSEDFSKVISDLEKFRKNHLDLSIFSKKVIEEHRPENVAAKYLEKAK